MADTDPLVYMLDLVDSLLDEAGAINDEYFGDFAPGSVAAEECDDTSLGSAVLTAYHIGAGQISAAMDFTSGVAHLCRPEISRYSVFAVARAALEASSRAWWILEEGLQRQDRAKRGLKERCRGLNERLRLETAMGESRIPSMRRMVEVREVARQVGIRGKLGMPPTVSDLLPKAFPAAGLSIDEGLFAMKHLSAYVHVTSFALISQTTASSDNAPLSVDPRVSLRTPTINYVELAYTIDSVANLLSLAFQMQVRAYGWDEKRWSSAWNRSKAELRRALIHILETEA